MSPFHRQPMSPFDPRPVALASMIDLELLAYELEAIGFEVAGVPRVIGAEPGRVVVEVFERCPCKSENMNRVTVTVNCDLRETIVRLFQQHLLDDQAEARGERVEKPAFTRTAT